MTTPITPRQETRLAELSPDFELALAMPAAMIGGEEGREKQLQRIASDVLAVFGEPVTFANDAGQVDESVVNRYLSATAAGREALKAKGIVPTGVNTVLDHERARAHARGEPEPTRERLDKILSATAIGQQIIRDREAKR